MHTGPRTFLLVVVGLALSACPLYAPPPLPSCTVRCGGADGGCPTGAVCRAGWCAQPAETVSCDCRRGGTRLCGRDFDAGICRQGVQFCLDNGTWSSCTGEVGPGTETCNGLDDDCDGVTDDGVATRSCLAGDAGVCLQGSQSCVAGDFGACALPPEYQPVESTCDGRDNDCDGLVDAVEPRLVLEGVETAAGTFAVLGTASAPALLTQRRVDGGSFALELARFNAALEPDGPPLLVTRVTNPLFGAVQNASSIALVVVDGAGVWRAYLVSDGGVVQVGPPVAAGRPPELSVGRGATLSAAGVVGQRAVVVDFGPDSGVVTDFMRLSDGTSRGLDPRLASVSLGGGYVHVVFSVEEDDGDGGLTLTTRSALVERSTGQDLSSPSVESLRLVETGSRLATAYRDVYDPLPLLCSLFGFCPYDRIRAGYDLLASSGTYVVTGVDMQTNVYLAPTVALRQGALVGAFVERRSGFAVFRAGANSASLRRFAAQDVRSVAVASQDEPMSLVGYSTGAGLWLGRFCGQ